MCALWIDSCCNLTFIYSDLREIPDNQEVFAHPTTDQSIIVEVMEYQHAEDDDQALRFLPLFFIFPSP